MPVNLELASGHFQPSSHKRLVQRGIGMTHSQHEQHTHAPQPGPVQLQATQTCLQTASLIRSALYHIRATHIQTPSDFAGITPA